jgi:digeranylgeranylglycerophospholipid reductase
MLGESYDLVIVGGGPGGCQTAWTAAEHGLSVLLVERDPDIGTPVRCAEGVSTAALREFYEPDPSFCRQHVTEFHFVAPNGMHVEIAGIGDGWILDRKVFDRRIAQDAIRAGARIVTNTNAVEARRLDDGRVGVRLEGRGEVMCRIVVGADGTESRAGRWLGLRTFCRPRDMESAAQYLVSGIHDVSPNRIEMWFGSFYAPGGYFWVFPKGEGVANVGLGISGEYGAQHNAFFYLDRMMDRHWPYASIIGRTMGGVPCTGGLKEIVGDNVMLVGDAAHQANPLTGGGITNAMKAGRIAGRVAAEAIRSGDVSKTGLRKYEKEWDDLLGQVHRRCHRIKEGVFRMTDEAFNRLAESIADLPPEERKLNKIVGRALVRQPRLLFDLARIVF